MRWRTWVVVGLMVVNAGWMLFDGARALAVGDYVTPRSGAHAGQLGPWSKLVEAAGIQPRSNLMKSLFVFYGAAALVVLAAFVGGHAWAWRGMLVVCVLGLWYLPLGTVINLVVIAVLQHPAFRAKARNS